MATTSLVRKKISRPLTALEDAFVSFYLGERGNTRANAALSYQHAQHSEGLPMSSSNSAASRAYKLLHSPRIARIIGRALAHRTATAEEITGRLTEIMSMPREHWEKGVMDAGNVVKAAEVLARLKRMGGDPLERLIIKQVKRMAARELPAEVAGLLEEGEDHPGLLDGRGQVSPVPPALPLPRSMRRPSAAPRTRKKRRPRPAAIDIEAQVVGAGHDAAQHEPMTQCVKGADQVEASPSAQAEAPRRSSAPRPVHPRPGRRG